MDAYLKEYHVRNRIAPADVDPNRKPETGVRRRSPDRLHLRDAVKNPTFQSWMNMWVRLGRMKSYAHLDFDPRWARYDLFLDDMGERPEGHTLDRKDNSKGYWKDNCRWATPKQQARNKTNNVLVTIEGVTRTAAEWAEEAGVTHSGFCKRLALGWSGPKLLTKARQWTKKQSEPTNVAKSPPCSTSSPSTCGPRVNPAPTIGELLPA